MKDAARCQAIEAAFKAENVVIAEVGAFNPRVWYGPHKDNFSKQFFDATVENCRHVIDAVKPKRTKFTVEMMGWSIQRPAFGVHIDVCNAINSPEKFYNNAAVTEDLFTKLGRWRSPLTPRISHGHP